MIHHIDPDSHPAAENTTSAPEPQRLDVTPRLSANLHFNDIEPWPEPIDGELLLNDLRQALLRFVVLPKWAPETLALWILHTYAFQLRDVTPYLGIESPEKRCGKTTLLSVLTKLVHRPVPASNISSPAFFRLIEELQPTLLIDEADTFLQSNDELRGILNAGYTRDTAYVMRVTHLASHPSSIAPAHNPRLGLARFSCWCPKVIAAIGRLPDTLADRCIVICMQRKSLHETCERPRNLDATNLPRFCARFILDHANAIPLARPEIPPGLNDRAADIWEPLLALADLAGGQWPSLARDAAVGFTAASHENNPIGALLLDILVTLVTHDVDRIFSRTLVLCLNLNKDRPWSALSRGKPINELWLSQQLRPYGIRPRTIWIGGEHAKGYLKEDFTETFRRYIPKSEVDALKAEVLATHPLTPLESQSSPTV